MQLEDKLAQSGSALKDLKRKLNKTEGNVEDVVKEKNEFKKKSEFLEEKLEDCKVKLSECERKLDLAQEDLTALESAN